MLSHQEDGLEEEEAEERPLVVTEPFQFEHNGQAEQLLEVRAGCVERHAEPALADLVQRARARLEPTVASAPGAGRPQLRRQDVVRMP